MSADHPFTMTAPTLVKAADKYQTCPTFHIEEGGSRYYCSDCRGTEEAHIIVALRTALANLTPLPGAGENDWDEEHRRREKLTSNERQQGMVDDGHEDWLDGRNDR